jgi:tetratricopeptide (TPR) repeat protein
MTSPDAVVHLRRAYDLSKVVEGKTEDLRTRAAAHDANLDKTDQPFLQLMWTGLAGRSKLGSEKAELAQDLQLATSELDKAISLDAEAKIDTADGPFNGTNMRALISLLYGQIEMVWGKLPIARQHLEYSCTLFEIPETDFMLGVVCESQYDVAAALKYYERYLALDPNGEFSVAALRTANQLRNYRKRFRGDWTLLILSFLVCFPISIIYFAMKYK